MKRKEKSGFTLVELLVIIAILAMIAITTYPAINSVIDRGKERSYRAQVKLLEEAAIDYVTKYPEEAMIEGEEKAQVTIPVLREKGLLQQARIVDPRNRTTMTGCIEITIDSYGQYQANYVERCVEQ